MKHKIRVWLYFLAGGLVLTAVLRDIFAPGFFAMSGRVMSTGYIIVEFAIGITFLAIGVLSSRRRHVDGIENK
jgi:hypothetical protein